MEESKPALITSLLCRFIRIYQAISVQGGRHCRFYPTCSEYMRQSLITYGFWRGLSLGISRILKCHPWNPGGVDLVESHGK